MKENHILEYDFNNTKIKPGMLDDYNKIILANWPTNKHTECNKNG